MLVADGSLIDGKSTLAAIITDKKEELKYPAIRAKLNTTI
jgi:hypothetical protein